MTSWEQAVARGKLQYMEKYKFGKLVDFDYVSRWLGYKVDFSDDKRQAVIHMPDGDLEVTVKDSYK